MFRSLKVIILVCVSAIFSLSVAQAQQPLGQPQNVRAVGETVYWDAVANAKDYRVRWGPENGSKKTFTVPDSETYLTFIGLQADTTYTIRVRARGDGKKYEKRGKWSEKLLLRLPPAEPQRLAAPGNFRLLSGSTVAWDAVQGADRYRLRLDPPNADRILKRIDPPQTQYTFENLQAGLLYTVRVRAMGDEVVYKLGGDWSASLQLKLPPAEPQRLAAPGNFRVLSGSTVAWDAVEGADRYRLRLDPPNADRILKRVDPPQTQYTFENLQTGLIYKVRVRAMGDETAYQLLGDWSAELRLQLPN